MSPIHQHILHIFSNKNLTHTILLDAYDEEEHIAKNEAARQMLQQDPLNTELCVIIECTDLTNEAGEILLKKRPSNEELCVLIRKTNLKEQAADILLKQTPSNKDLCTIIEYTDLANEAGEMLLKQNPSDEELCVLIRKTNVKVQAADMLLKVQKSSSSDFHLAVILSYVPSKKNEVLHFFIQQPHVYTLKAILERDKPWNVGLYHLEIPLSIKDELIKLLIEKTGCTEDTLKFLIQYTHQKEERWEQLLALGPTKKTLLWLVQYSNFTEKPAALLLQQTLLNDELVTLIRCTRFKQEAWELLRTKNPSNENLLWLVKWKDIPFKQEAWKLLLQQTPSNYALLNLINDSDFPFKEEVWEMLPLRTLLKSELLDLICRSTFLFKEEAWELLRQQTLSNNELITLINNSYFPFKEEAWKILRTQSPSNENLIQLIQWSGLPFKKEVAELILNQSPSNKDLRVLIEETAIKDKAAEILLHQNPSLRDLHYIIAYSNQKDQAVEMIIEQHSIIRKDFYKLVIYDDIDDDIDDASRYPCDPWDEDYYRYLRAYSSKVYEVWEELLAQQPFSNKELCTIIQHCASYLKGRSSTLLELAIALLLKQAPSEEDIQCIAQCAKNGYSMQFPLKDRMDKLLKEKKYAEIYRLRNLVISGEEVLDEFTKFDAFNRSFRPIAALTYAAFLNNDEVFITKTLAQKIDPNIILISIVAFIGDYLYPQKRYKEIIRLSEIVLDIQTQRSKKHKQAQICCSNALWILQNPNIELPVDKAVNEKFLSFGLLYKNTNPVFYYHAACLDYIQHNDFNNAMKCIELAKTLQFKEYDNIVATILNTTDKSFVEFKNHPPFIQWITKHPSV